MARIQTDSTRGLLRKHSIRQPQFLPDLDDRLYGVSIADCNDIELAATRWEGGANARPVIGAGATSFDVTATPIGAGTTLATVLLLRGYHTITLWFQSTEATTAFRCVLEQLAPSATLVNFWPFLAPVGSQNWINFTIKVWIDSGSAQAPSTIRLRNIPAPSATTVIHGHIGIVRHWSDVQGPEGP